MTGVIEIFEKGGPVMWPILACSVISLTITIERLIFWWREEQRHSEKLVERIFTLCERREYEKATQDAGAKPCGVVRMLVAGLIHREHGLMEAMEVSAGDEVERMKRGLQVLDTIVTMAPMLGILGTVTGIIKSFNLLGTVGVTDPRAATSGLAEALITTAAGLIVALLTLVPLNYFASRVTASAKHIEQVAAQFGVAYRKSRVEKEE